MHSELCADQSQLGWRDEFLMCDRHSKELAIEVALPAVEELLEPREAGVDIVVLPDVALEERGMIRQAMKNLRRRQTEADELRTKIAIGYGGQGRSPHPADTLNGCKI